MDLTEVDFPFLFIFLFRPEILDIVTKPGLVMYLFLIKPTPLYIQIGLLCIYVTYDVPFSALFE